MLDFAKDAELVIGIVGKMGTDTKSVFRWVKTALQAMNYEVHLIKLTNHIKETPYASKIVDNPVEEKYKTYIKACNDMRELSERNDLFAHIACLYIREARRKKIKSLYDLDDPQIAAPRTAYFVDQIKRPEEAEKLREIYGDQFILISSHIGKSESVNALARRIANSHPESPRHDTWVGVAADLFDQDEMEEEEDFGQRVRKVFHLADVVIDGLDKGRSEALLNRFFQALFGDYTVSPTREEFFQNVAHNVSLTSCDLARQVGAAIEVDGEIAATGFNEAPRAFGGTYWAEEGYDARDVVLGEDINTIRKRQMVIEIIEKLKNNKSLIKSIRSLTPEQLEEKFLDSEKAPLKNSQIMDTLEYGRSVHAEMAAITTAARLGRTIKGGSLYCTTFPCHNCAKHIVAAGLESVVYLEPYPKSFVIELYPDSIRIDERDETEDHVVFEQFIGITPKRYGQLFAKERFKDEKGYVPDWIATQASPIVNIKVQEHQEREILFSKEIEEILPTGKKRRLGLISAS